MDSLWIVDNSKNMDVWQEEEIADNQTFLTNKKKFDSEDQSNQAAKDWINRKLHPKKRAKKRQCSGQL